jgi:hypothetical protein
VGKGSKEPRSQRVLLPTREGRTQVQEITGKAGNVAVVIIQLCSAEGYFETSSPKGPLDPAFPIKVSDVFFPRGVAGSGFQW